MCLWFNSLILQQTAVVEVMAANVPHATTAEHAAATHGKPVKWKIKRFKILSEVCVYI